MKSKKLLFGLLMILSLAVLAGCTAPAPAASPTPAPTATAAPTAAAAIAATPAVSSEPSPAATPWLVLTLEELKAYNGQNGMSAYIAVDGKIYDVTGSAMWRGGAHNGFAAGKDLTAEIKSVSPHGVKVLDRVPVVGEIKQ